MKKNILLKSLLLTVLVFALGFTSCKKKDPSAEFDKALLELVEGVKYPYDTKVEGVSVTSCTYVNKVLTYNYQVDKKKVFKRIKDDKSSAQALEHLKSELLPRSLQQKLVKAGASVCLNFLYEGETVTINFSNDDLKD